jgi:lysophospholipid acyltransferase (LPLAT)-like uncharacterized protein
MSPLGKRIVESIAPPAAYWYIRLLQATVRRRYENREALHSEIPPSAAQIYAFWHSRLVFMRFSWSGDKAVVLQSRHRDSRMLAQVMSRFGLGAVWGSTTRGGMAAMRGALRKLKEGYTVAIAPDGPRGPRRRVQPGVIAIARLSGVPIVPLAYSARPSRRLGSWDRMLLPLPFGRALFVYGRPMKVPRDADEGEQERLRRVLEDELNRLTDAADEAMGIPRVEPAPSREPRRSERVEDAR